MSQIIIALIFNRICLGIDVSDHHCIHANHMLELDMANMSAMVIISTLELDLSKKSAKMIICILELDMVNMSANDDLRHFQDRYDQYDL